MEITTRMRAAYVMDVLGRTYVGRSGECPAIQGTDIIADIMHLCDHAGYDFGEMLRRAHMHHAAELEEEIAAGGGRN